MMTSKKSRLPCGLAFVSATKELSGFVGKKREGPCGPSLCVTWTSLLVHGLEVHGCIVIKFLFAQIKLLLAEFFVRKVISVKLLIVLHLTLRFRLRLFRLLRLREILRWYLTVDGCDRLAHEELHEAWRLLGCEIPHRPILVEVMDEPHGPVASFPLD